MVCVGGVELCLYVLRVYVLCMYIPYVYMHVHAGVCCVCGRGCINVCACNTSVELVLVGAFNLLSYRTHGVAIL